MLRRGLNHQLWLFPTNLGLKPQFLLAMIAKKEMEMKKEEEKKQASEKFSSTLYEGLSGRGKEVILAVKQKALEDPKRKERGREAIQLSGLFEGVK